jgi:uncharacterized protein
MMQYLIIAALIALIYFIYFKKKPQKVSSSKKEKTTKEQANEMIECATCGVYSELDESILSNGKYYCSDECVARRK